MENPIEQMDNLGETKPYFWFNTTIDGDSPERNGGLRHPNLVNVLGIVEDKLLGAPPQKGGPVRPFVCWQTSGKLDLS